MEMPKINVRETFNKGLDGVKNSYTNHIKPAMENGIKYTKDLAHDTVDFVAKNPKKTGMIAGAVIAVIGLGALIGKLVKTNNIKSEHIAHQREIIGALKEEVGVRDELIGGLHDAVEAAISNNKKA